MKKILASLVLTAAAAGAVAMPTAANAADYNTTVCVLEADGTPNWSAWTISDPSEVAGMLTQPFPYGQPGGCSAFAFGDLPVVCPTTEIVPDGFAPVAPYQARIDRLRAKVQRLKARLAAQR